MADSTEAVHVIAAGAPAPENSSSAVEGPVSATGGEEFRSLRDVARSLPSHAVRDLLCNEVCPRCIFRLFGVQDHIYSCSSTSQLVLSSILDELADPQRSMVDNDFSEKKESSRPLKESEVELGLCRICLGVVQFVYRDDKDALVKKDAAKDFASSIVELVKKEEYQIDNFSLEVSVPPIISENENAVWLYMKKKYGSELWFQERSRSVLISAKDVLKFSIADSLETLLDVKSGPGSFRIRLTYTHPKASDMISCSSKSNAGGKRQKTGTENSFETVDEPMAARIQHSEFSTSKTDAVTETSLNGSLNHESSECFKFPKDKVNEPWSLAFLCYRTSIYFGGRYLKFSRNVSQSRWIIDDERMGEASVEEILGSNILPMCRGDSYKFHAAGREDIDVRMLGSGRPFLVEILNARLVPSQVLAKQIEEKINNEKNKLVQVKNLKVVGSEGWALMREGESEKQKQYAALVWISRPLEDKDLESLSSFNDLKILQRTPIRVLHRRSPLDREKIIHWMKIEKIAESSQYFILHLSTQAGTYIKEFVHGDLGRTHPNIGSILGCRAEILQLDVTDVKMDCFMTES